MIIKNNLIKVLFYTLFILVSVSSLQRTIKKNLDFKVFHGAAVRMYHGDYNFYDHIRDGVFTYKYSPIFPVMSVPFALFSEDKAKVIWAFVNFFSLPLAWFCLLMFFKNRFKIPVDYGAQLLTLIMLLRPITNNAIQGNINMILLLIMGASLYYSDKGKKMLAGFLASIPFAIKLTPGVLFLYFLFFRKWKELAVMCISSFVLLVALPAIVYGVDQTLDLYQGWITVLRDTKHFPFFKYTNQSPLVVMIHIVGEGIASKIFYYGVNVVLVTGIAYFVLKRSVLGVVTLLFSLMLTASPVVWIEYYLFLIIPYFLVNSMLVEKLLSRAGIILWSVRFVVATLLVQFTVGKELAREFSYYGQQLWGLALLLSIMIIERRKILDNEVKF